MDIEVVTSLSLIGITLTTPTREVTIENEGYDFAVLMMLDAIIRRPFG
ncbi:hypothetical protein [Croceicoccus sediminis]|nr:hypothetical protein [Croceicoccus sediminis]